MNACKPATCFAAFLCFFQSVVEERGIIVDRFQSLLHHRLQRVAVPHLHRPAVPHWPCQQMTWRENKMRKRKLWEAQRDNAADLNRAALPCETIGFEIKILEMQTQMCLPRVSDE